MSTLRSILFIELFVVPLFGSSVVLNLDFVKDCCSKRCGTIAAPLQISSPGFNKVDESHEIIRITTTDNNLPRGDQLNQGSSESSEICMVAICTDPTTWATLNISFFVRGNVGASEVIVSDSDKN